MQLKNDYIVHANILGTDLHDGFRAKFENIQS